MREESISNSSCSFCFAANGREMHRMINTHIEASKIGRQIAVQVLDYHRRAGDSSSGNKSEVTINGSKIIFLDFI